MHSLNRSIKSAELLNMRQAGRHFLQIPGPSPVPDRILRAIDMPVIDHRALVSLTWAIGC